MPRRCRRADCAEGDLVDRAEGDLVDRAVRGDSGTTAMLTREVIVQLGGGQAVCQEGAQRDDGDARGGESG